MTALDDDSKAAAATIETEMHEYLRLQPHQRDNLSILLYECDSPDLPALIVTAYPSDDAPALQMVKPVRMEKLFPLLRQLLASDAPRARFAVDVFVHRVAREIGALAAEMGGLDGVVFTAGIGEHAAEIRRRVMSRCLWLGLTGHDGANREGAPERRISAVDSRCEAWVIPTDEELMMARHTFRLLAGE